MAKNNSQTTHEMKLVDPWFSNMERGLKTLELRLYDDKRKMLKPGDQITFRKFPALDRFCVMEVTGLLHYATFEELLNDVNISWLAYEDKDRPWLLNAMYDIYTREDEAEYGVLGIRLKKPDAL